MSYKKTNDEKDKWRSSPNDGYDIYDTLNENFARTLNELSKFQPHYLQSISDLQQEYIQTVKNIIKNTASTQKELLANGNSIAPLSIPIPLYLEQFITRQLNEFTNNTVKVSNLNSQFNITIVDNIRENLDIYNRATDALNKYNTNVAKAWSMFFSPSALY